MEAKTWQDTVISSSQIKTIDDATDKLLSQLTHDTEGHLTHKEYREMCENGQLAKLQTQAKITWDIASKAGKAEGELKAEKVVEWIKLHSIIAPVDREWNAWQAFLKEIFKDHPELLKKWGVK